MGCGTYESRNQFKSGMQDHNIIKLAVTLACISNCNHLKMVSTLSIARSIIGQPLQSTRLCMNVILQAIGI